MSSFNYCSLLTDLNYTNPFTAQAGKELDGPQGLTDHFLALLRPQSLAEVRAYQASG